MKIQIIIDEKFMGDLLIKICRSRFGNCEAFPCLPCCANTGVGTNCDLIERCNDLNWRECVRAIGGCFIGFQMNESWAISRYKDNLIKCLNSSVHIDWLLHLSQKRYRDHSIHQLFVGGLGWYLLGCKFQIPGENHNTEETKTITLRQWIAEKIDLPINELDIAWWLASLFHDHSYPLGHMLRVTPSILENNQDNLMEHIWNLLGYSSNVSIFNGLYDASFLGKLYNCAENNRNSDISSRRKAIFSILKDYLCPYFSDDELKICSNSYSGTKFCYDHGVLGAANISALVGGSDANLFRHVVRAIAMHNGAISTEKINVEEDPLAFLLILCDECQEWGRRIVVGDEAKAESENIKLIGVQVEEDDCNQATFSDELTVIFEYTDASCLSETEWNYSLFSQSKEKAFGRLRASDDFPIKKINFQVWIPHEKKFDT